MMNVAKTQLVFHSTKLLVIKRNGFTWLTASDLAEALQYSNAKSVTNLYNQNADEFSENMSQVIESVTSGNYRKKVRVFSLRGAHLLAMFARTAIAKEFRRWVLDILECEGISRKRIKEEKIKAICPCCGNPAVIIESRYITRNRTEIISKCKRQGCPDQIFSSEIYFSHYLEKKVGSQDMEGLIQSLSFSQKQSLIHLLTGMA